MTFSPSNTLGPFIQTSIYFPEEFEEFRVKFLEVYRDISNATNTRDVAIFDLVEFLSGQQWFTPGNAQVKRRTFRKVIPFTPLVAGLNSFPHGIAGIGASFTFTNIVGTGRNAAGTVQVPFPQGGANTSMLEIDPVNINLTIPAAYAGFSTLITLEYLRN